MKKFDKIDDHKAQSKIAIVIIHLDMIPEEKRYSLKNKIIDELGAIDVSANLIAFGEKECKWNESELQDHEKKKRSPTSKS